MINDSDLTLRTRADATRARIYDRYASARSEQLAPADVAGLASRAPYFRRLITRCFPPGRDAAILDLGCGHGALLYFAREAGYHNVAGVDRSPEQVAAAQQLGIEGVTEGDIFGALEHMPAGSRDVVITFDVIEHLASNEMLRLVDDIHRVLVPGGRWLIHVPNGESPFFGRIRYGDITHETAFTRSSLAQLLLSSGFSTVQCYEEAPVVHGLKSAARFVLWKCIRCVLHVYLAAETGRLSEPAIFSQNLLAVGIK